jgi:O-antigen polymerase
MTEADMRRATKQSTGWKSRMLLVLGILAYVGCFQWMYVHYLYPMFDYFGYDYNPPGTGYLALAWVLSVFPSVWMPLELKRPSQLAYWILYITVLIPSMFVPLYAALNPPPEISVLMMTLFAGFVIAGASYLLPLFRIRSLKISSRAYWKGFGFVAGALTLWMLVVFHKHLQILSFQYVDDLRRVASDIGEGSRVNYSYMWLSGVINPFLMGWGLYYRRRWLFLIGALGQLLVYSVVGSKSSILSVLFILGFYLLFKLSRLAFALKLTLGSLALMGGFCLSYYFSGENPGLIQLILLAVVFQRTLSEGGLITAQYYDFFQRNPLTYLSHIHGVNLFVHYPYKYTIGEEVGLAYAGTTDLDATGHFWAADGLGGFGLPGVLLISVLCALVFWVLDSTARRHDPRLIALLISFSALNLANASFFTSLLSGGLGLLIFLIYLMPRGDYEVSVSPAKLVAAKGVG